MTGSGKIEAHARRVRAFLEPRWQQVQRAIDGQEAAIPSTNMCRFSALFLFKTLDAAFPGCRWHAKEGFTWYHPLDDSVPQKVRSRGIIGGFFDGERWHEHTWVEGQAQQGRIIVDVTADQFGADPVIVTGKDDPRYRSNVKADHTREHLKDVRMHVGEWLDAWEQPEPSPTP